jgi:hypothetical protein
MNRKKLNISGWALLLVSMLNRWQSNDSSIGGVSPRKLLEAI